VYDPRKPEASIMVRVIFDSGSQRSYITNKVKDHLSLNPRGTETMLIKTFGSDKGNKQFCELVCLDLGLCNEGSVELLFMSVPLICDPLTNQPISQALERYEYLADLNLADHSYES